jgi:DNA-binding SARP family transcriptional activator
MLGFRPKLSELYVERPRLLELLPDSEGYVVWLEAPYGYGKSVLAAQWAKELERDHWRVLWMSVEGRELKPGLATLLELPGEALWGMVLDELWRKPTLLVLEDLSGSEELNPLLKDVRGLLLIASRNTLPYHELPRLATQGRVIHVQAKQLAFTSDEAKALFADEKSAEQAWQRSQGWSLPLHFAALTGETPDTEALLEGIQESLSPEAWHEALFLSTVPYLPHEAANDHGRELGKAGFAQTLEAGLRLHPLVAETLLNAYQAEAREVLKTQLQRLPVGLQAEALAKVQLLSELSQLLEHNHTLARDYPERLLYWASLCPSPPGPGRLLALAWSLSTLGKNEAALERLEQALAHPQTTAEQKLIALGWYLSVLAPNDKPRAQQLFETAQALLPSVSNKRAATFLINASVFYYKAQDWAGLESLQHQAQAYVKDYKVKDYDIKDYDNAEEHQAIIALNLAESAWEQHGDLVGLIAELERNLPIQERFNPFNVVLNHYRQGVSRALLDDARALDHFDKAQLLAQNNLREGLLAQAEKAALLSDVDAFADIARQIRVWETSDADVVERTYTLWARTLRKAGRCKEALELLETQTGLAANGERALLLHELGKKKEALKVLPDPASSKQRLIRLELQAAHYLVTQQTKDLDELLTLTTSREKILPSLIPLTALPKQRLQLSKVYPLKEVLLSGWKEAVQLRHAEIPNLGVRVLGRVSVTVLEQELDLSSRQRELLTLLSLRKTREEIGAALWPEVSIDKMRNNLDVQLNLLRKLLEPWGLTTYLTKEGLERCTVDLWRLEAALGQNDADTIVKLYKPLAPDVDIPLVDESREELKERVVEALFQAAQKLSESVLYLEKLLELDPLHEEALQLLLEKLIARGRKREAMKRYQKFAEKLRTDTGLEPLGKTQQLLS